MPVVRPSVPSLGSRAATAGEETAVTRQVRTLDELDQALDGATLLGLELDPRYRVLAATLEPVAGRAPWETADADDRRLQLLCAPVSTILASLRRVDHGRVEVLRFAETQLVDVVAALDGPTVATPLFGRPEPRPGTWAPTWSLEGRSNAPDGTRRTLTVQVERPEADGTLELDVFARFDDVQVRDAAGRDLWSAPGG